MSERINNLATIEAIAERCGVKVTLFARGFGNRRVIALYGPKPAIEEALGQIQGYHIEWEEEKSVPMVYLYSNRTNWAEAGY